MELQFSVAPVVRSNLDNCADAISVSQELLLVILHLDGINKTHHDTMHSACSQFILQLTGFLEPGGHLNASGMR